MFDVSLNTTVQALLVFLVVLIFVYKYVIKDDTEGLPLPPGPKPIPMLGNLLTLGSDPREPLRKHVWGYFYSLFWI